jgi:DNA-directed RNA polymerase specialized sigma24 family protein
MSNHYHLLLETPAGNLSQIMRHINGAYTNHFNTKRRRAGHLLQGRYRAILVEADVYAKELSRYIHLNPVRTGITEQPGEYPWSSYRCYSGKEQPSEWLCMDMILADFAKNLQDAARRYAEFVESALQEQEDPLQRVVSSTLLGSEKFIQTICDKYLKGRKAERDVPAVRHLLTFPSAESIFKAVDKACKEVALAKQVKLYLFHQFSGLKLKDIAARFGIGESAVSLASHRMKLKMKKDAGLRNLIQKIREDIGL